MNNFDYYFNEKIAEIGAMVCKNFLTTRPNVSNVIDLQKTEYGKINNVDFSYIKNNELKELAEVKCDMIWWSGNICLEIISNNTKDTLGCFLATKSNIWLHVFPHIKTAYLFKTPEIKKWFISNQSKFREVKCNTLINNQYAYSTISKLVPITELLNIPQFFKKIPIPEKWMPNWTKNLLIELDDNKYPHKNWQNVWAK